METVYNDAKSLTNKLFTELLDFRYQSPSPLFRLDKLEKYGVISEKTQLQIKLFLCNYKNTLGFIRLFKNNNNLKPTKEEKSKYESAKELIKQNNNYLKNEFQAKIAEYMPKIVRSNREVVLTLHQSYFFPLNLNFAILNL